MSTCPLKKSLFACLSYSIHLIQGLLGWRRLASPRGGRRRVQTEHIAQQQEASDKELRQAALNGDLLCVKSSLFLAAHLGLFSIAQTLYRLLWRLSLAPSLPACLPGCLPACLPASLPPSLARSLHVAGSVVFSLLTIGVTMPTRTTRHRKLRAQLKMGVNVDGRAGDGQTALCIAASEGYPALTAALVEAGADLNLPNSQTSFTPLHSAVHAGHTEVVRVLVAAGADLSAKNRRKKTPLQLALSRKHTEIVRVLQGTQGDSDDTDSDESI